MSPTPKNNYYVLPVGQIGGKRPEEPILVQCFSFWLQSAWDMIVMNTKKFRISIIQCEKRGKKNAIQFPESFFVLVFDPFCVNSVKIFFFPPSLDILIASFFITISHYSRIENKTSRHIYSHFIPFC